MAIAEIPSPTLSPATPRVVTPSSSLGMFRRPVSSGGWRTWVFTVDHKKLGLMYGVVAFFFFIVGGVEALLIRLQLAVADGKILSAEAYNQFVLALRRHRVDHHLHTRLPDPCLSDNVSGIAEVR